MAGYITSLKEAADKLAAADAFKVPAIARPWINGEFKATGGTTLTNFAPGTGKPLCKVEVSGQAELDAAVSAAKEALPAWRALSGAERGRILNRAAALMREFNRELAELEAVDAGLPISECLYVQVSTGYDALEYFGGMANGCLTGTTIDLPHAGGVGAGGQHSFGYTRREPLGVCAGIGAWNYPIQICLWKVAPALACGNCFIFKPSECTPLTALALGPVLKAAGVPDGVFSVLPGDRDLGPRITAHRGISHVAFTGSVATGVLIAAACAQTLKRVTLELGGKSPLLIFDDAELDNAVGAALMANFYTNGEICCNGTRVYVQRGILKRFLAKVKDRTEKLVIGDVLDEGTHVGPMMMMPDKPSAHYDKVMGYIDRAKATKGLSLLCGGDRVELGDELSGGFYVRPTIFVDDSDTTEDSDATELSREEVFGPVMLVLPFDTEEEAVRRANDTQYGLAAGVMTTNLARGHRIAKQFEAGTVWINNYNLAPVEMPFGAFKMSGYGKECSQRGIEEYTQIKSVYVEGGDVDSSCYPD